MNDIIEAISCEKEIIQLKLLNVPKHPEFQLKLNQAIMKLKDEFKQIQIYQIRKYAKVAVGGKLVETTPGLAAEVFDVLGQANIHFYQITTSKRTISLVIDKENLDQAIQLLKERFHIEEDK